MTELKDLSPEQRQVVETWGQGMAVMAGAGSGKTTTLVIKCAELLKRKPEARFCAVSFTEKSASDLREKLSARRALQSEGGALSGHWVMTIHGLCGAIIREYPREAGFDGEESIIAENEAQLLWGRALDSLWTDDLPPEVLGASELLLARESKDGLESLLKRVKDLQLFGILDSLAQAEDESPQALAVVGKYVLDRYERQKRRRGVLDFNDLEKGADQALKHPEIRAAFQKRFDLVMVDEFQDTNPVQAGIIWRFVRPDLSNLCVVGDPKQSIYRFRDADVSVFEDCCSKLPVNLSLTWNFRSRPGIIDFANQVCGQAFPVSQMKYEALVPKRETSAEHEPVLRLNVKTPVELGAWIRSQMENGVPLHEMALLLRKIRGNEKWIKALTACGIPIAVGSGGLFWEDPRVRELTSFLKWWANPANSFSGAVFLRSPWVGVPDEQLDQWVRKDKTWQEGFFSSSHPLALALKPYRDRVVRPGELLMALLISEEIESELGAQCLGLWHRAEELSSRGLDFHSVVTELAGAMEQSRRERDVPPPRNLGQLMVLTLHASKGLEFPHVVLIDFPVKKPKEPSMPLLFWHREKGAFLGKRTPDGERDRKDTVEAEWREYERAQEVAESKRLFYVALTRARERLVLVFPEPEVALPGAASDGVPVADLGAAGAMVAAESGSARKSSRSKKGQSEMEPESPFAKDHWRQWLEALGVEIPLAVSASVDLSRRLSEQALESSPPTAAARFVSARALDPIPLHRPRFSVTEWNTLTRCGRAYEWTYVRPLQVAEGIPELGLFSGKKVKSYSDEEMSQKELGKRVHKSLELGDFDSLKQLEEQVGASRFMADSLVSWATSSELMAPAHPDGSRQVWPELAFEVAVGPNEALVGSIDRLVVHRPKDSEASYTIIDFKVTEKPKSVDALLEAYEPQLRLYAWAMNQIEPESLGRTNALLVNISSRTIQTVPVSLFEGIDVSKLLEESREIIRGGSGKARTGPLCRVCEFRAHCQEGLAYFGE